MHVCTRMYRYLHVGHSHAVGHHKRKAGSVDKGGGGGNTPTTSCDTRACQLVFYWPHPFITNTAITRSKCEEHVIVWAVLNPVSWCLAAMADVVWRQQRGCSALYVMWVCVCSVCIYVCISNIFYCVCICSMVAAAWLKWLVCNMQYVCVHTYTQCACVCVCVWICSAAAVACLKWLVFMCNKYVISVCVCVVWQQQRGSSDLYVIHNMYVISLSMYMQCGRSVMAAVTCM